LVYSATVKERFRDVDLVIGAGDLPMDYLGFIASSLNKPVLFVFGNHNLKQLSTFQRGTSAFNHPVDDQEDRFYGSTYIDNRVNRTKGLIIAGLGGSLRYNKGENQFSDFQMYLKIARLFPSLIWNRFRHGRYLDILVTHTPPLGINDRDDPCHRGFRSFLWFMRAFKPRYLLHGHIHLYDQNSVREAMYQDTRIINVYDYFVLDIEPKVFAERSKG
jgi:Icc-related predicted phosphoesterase